MERKTARTRIMGVVGATLGFLGICLALVGTHSLASATLVIVGVFAAAGLASGTIHWLRRHG